MVSTDRVGFRVGLTLVRTVDCYLELPRPDCNMKSLLLSLFDLPSHPPSKFKDEQVLTFPESLRSILRNMKVANSWNYS